MNPVLNLAPANLKKRFPPSGLAVFLVANSLAWHCACQRRPFSAALFPALLAGIVIGALSNPAAGRVSPAAGLAALRGALVSIGDYSLFLCAVLIVGIPNGLLGLAKPGGASPTIFPAA